MPSIRRFAPTRRGDSNGRHHLDEWDEQAFASGIQIGPCNYTAEHWAVWEDDFTQRWAADRPGTRPGAWWRWSAPEGRRVVGKLPKGYLDEWGGLHAGDDNRRPGPRYWIPPKLKGAWGAFCMSREPRPGAIQYLEHEHEYLDRLGLWYEGERELWLELSQAEAEAGDEEPAAD